MTNVDNRARSTSSSCNSSLVQCKSYTPMKYWIMKEEHNSSSAEEGRPPPQPPCPTATQCPTFIQALLCSVVQQQAAVVGARLHCYAAPDVPTHFVRRTLGLQLKCPWTSLYPTSTSCSTEVQHLSTCSALTDVGISNVSFHKNETTASLDFSWSNTV